MEVLTPITKQKYIPKHHNHKFQRDYEKVIIYLKRNDQLKVGNLIRETKKILDDHVEYYFNNKQEISIELLNGLYSRISTLEKENAILKNTNNSLIDINLQLHKQIFDLDNELKSTLEGMIN